MSVQKDTSTLSPSIAAHSRPGGDNPKVDSPEQQQEAGSVSDVQQDSPPLDLPAVVKPKHAKLRNSIASLQSQIAARKVELSLNLDKLRQEDESTAGDTDELTIQDAERIVAKHIKLLHGYNEIKDIGLGLLGLIADKEGKRLGDIMDERGVSDKD